jgi:DNA-binding response OmpR family regulator
LKTPWETFPETVAGSRRLPLSAARRLRILVADDDVYTRELNAGVLIRSGYEVDTVADGAAAWRALDGERYDLLITDQRMPRVTGLELVQKLRSEDMTLPVILTSELEPVDDLKRFPGLIIDAVVKKPCTLEDLLQAVRRVLSVIGGTRDGDAPSSTTQSQT